MAAGSTVDLSFGITIVFTTTGFTGELLDVSVGPHTRETVDVTHQGVAAPSANEVGNMLKKFSDISDAGQVTFNIHANTDFLTATHQPPVEAAPETITITMPKTSGDTTAANLAGTGGIVSSTLGAPFKDKVTWDVVVEWESAPSWTAAVS